MGYRKIELGREWIFCEARFKTLKDKRKYINQNEKYHSFRKKLNQLQLKLGEVLLKTHQIKKLGSL